MIRVGTARFNRNRFQPVVVEKMITTVDEKSEAVADICRQFHVRRLELFGSANTNEFDQQTSDLDFLVDFLPGTDLGPWLAHYFDLQRALEDLFHRHIDLVMPSAIRNPHFANHVNRTRRLLYEVEDSEAA